jgi:hypothetical protein
MRFALVLSSLSLAACSLVSGSEPVQLAADPDPARPGSPRVALPIDDDDIGKRVASLPGQLTCVGDVDNEDNAIPQVVRLSIVTSGGGNAQVWLSTGRQFRSHGGEWDQDETPATMIDAHVQVFGDVVMVRGDGIDLAVDGVGAFREAASFDDSAFAGALTCWDDQAIWGSPWAGIPSALPAHFDWISGSCVDDDGVPALNDLPIEFVRESGFGDCADLSGQALNGGDYNGPDLWLSLRGARLDGAKLFFATLQGSFEGADLGGLGWGYATITGSFDDHTTLPRWSHCTEIESPWGAAQIECAQ